LPKRRLTRIQVNELPNVLSGRPLIPVAKPFQAPPGFPRKPALAGDLWSDLVESAAPRPKRRRAQGGNWLLLASTAAVIVVGLGLTALMGRQASPKAEPMAVASLPQVAPATPATPATPALAVTPEPRKDEPRLEPDSKPEPLQPNKPAAKELLADPAPVMPVAVAAAPPVAPPDPPAPRAEIPIADKPAACAECQKKAGSYGTSLEFAESPTEAAKLASKQSKLMFVVHISGNFEDDKFT
jgi:hypothetical protein